ncbi:TatD family hydrolase [Candidatus Parcubacteria bacterium]|nr:TatD family hydrolase [Candidatus Parcubacteria bacterium]
MKYFDIHSHLNFPEYDSDREEVLERMTLAETGTIVVGTDFASSDRAVRLAERHKNVWACVGVHPVDDPTKGFEAYKFEELLRSHKVVVIGECGLDFFHEDKNNLIEVERQKHLFLEQIHFALKFDRPIMIHSRAAYVELLEILEPLKREHGKKLRGNIHFFAGDLEIAKRFWAIDFTTSFTGVITFARNYDEVIKAAPLEMLMSETDAPYVAPIPYRGKRNEPSYVSEVVRKIADIRGEDFDIIQKALIKNVQKVFKIAEI